MRLVRETLPTDPVPIEEQIRKELEERNKLDESGEPAGPAIQSVRDALFKEVTI